MRRRRAGHFLITFSYLPTLYHLDINGIPIFNVNNNCASGSSAFALATQAVESGAVECALALGFEQDAGVTEKTLAAISAKARRNRIGTDYRTDL